MMKTIAVIPARYAATRFPGKLMAQLGEKTVIRTTYENTVNTGLFDNVFVVTDAQIIYNEIVQHGGVAVMSERKHETGSDRIAEAIENIDCEIVVNVQGDEPFVDKTALEGLIEAYRTDVHSEIDVSTLVREMTDENDIANPDFVKVVIDKEGFALYFSRSPIPYMSRSDFRPKYYEHIGVYAFRKEALMRFSKLPMLQNERAEKLEQLRFIDHGMRIKVFKTEYAGIEIDTPEDLEKANAFLKRLESNGIKRR